MHTNDTDHVDHRLTALEIKASFTEVLVDDLNQVIVRQQQQIDHLQRALATLAQQVQSPAHAAMAAGSARDELPPHY